MTPQTDHIFLLLLIALLENNSHQMLGVSTPAIASRSTPGPCDNSHTSIPRLTGKGSTGAQGGLTGDAHP